VSARRFALVAGGGTGGHLVPALAVAHALGEGMGPGAVELVGARRGLDAALTAGEGVPITLLPGHGLARRHDPRSVVANLGALAGLAAAFVGALWIVARRRPAVVVAMGGYACVPTALAAAVLRVPVVLVNVDAVPGAASRLVGRFAQAAAVAFEGVALPRAVVTGAPVRAAVVAAAGDAGGPDSGGPDASGRARSAARRALGLPDDRLVVAVVGGSLGSKRLNDAVLGLAGRWAKRTDVALYHVVGRRDASWTGAAVPSSEGPGLVYVQVPYEEHMELLYEAADIVVARAGANTVAELAVMGVPALLVPLPDAPDDHQRANAAVLERVHAAVVVPDAECDAARLAQEIDTLASDPDRMHAMGAAARALGRPGAVAAVAELARAHARAPHRGARAAHAR
jgi:undecaprenyldiphospho-muramoylpentapeptide beta-N-acetylglucosaminyltransferase